MLWFWGLCGAFGYAFPRLLKAWKETENTPGRWWAQNLMEAMIRIGVGVIFATAATPFIGHRYPWTVDPSPICLATVLGLYANQAEPMLTRAINRWIRKQTDVG